jgi:hypothetical protein
MHGRRGVTVEIEGDRHGGVAEHFAHEFGMYALTEQECRRRMARVVRPHDRDTGPLPQPMPARDASLTDRFYARGCPRCARQLSVRGIPLASLAGGLAPGGTGSGGQNAPL